MDVPEVSLTFYEITHDDCEVEFGDRLAGRIILVAHEGGRHVWLWTITGPYLPPELLPSNGECGSLNDAKTAFQGKFTEWQAWAAGHSSEAEWHGLCRQAPR